MKNQFIYFASFFIVTLLSLNSCNNRDDNTVKDKFKNENHVINENENPRFLFVLSAESGSFEGDVLTLTGVPMVIYYSDRPDRIAGHISLKKFVENWNKGSDSFMADPPNATLSILNEEGNENAIVELSNPEIKGNVVEFDVRLLYGSIEPEFSTSGLFIDGIIGTPDEY